MKGILRDDCAVRAYPKGDGSFDAATLTWHSVPPYGVNMSEELAKRIDHVDPMLTLKGLKAIHHRNEKVVS